MADLITLHVSPAVAAAITVETLAREVVLPPAYSIASVTTADSRKNSYAVPLLKVLIAVDGPEPTPADWSAPDIESAVTAAVTVAYRRTLPTSAETPIYVKHKTGYAICRGGLDAVRSAGVPAGFSEEVYGGETETPASLNAHLWFHEGVGAGVIARTEPSHRDWEDVRKSLDAAIEATTRIMRRRAERAM